MRNVDFSLTYIFGPLEILSGVSFTLYLLEVGEDNGLLAAEEEDGASLSDLLRDDLS